MYFEVTITVVERQTDELGEVIHGERMAPKRKRFSAYYQIPSWLSPDGNLVCHGDTEELAVDKLREMIRVFHADTLLSRTTERVIANEYNGPTEFTVEAPCQASEICLDCVKCRFMNVKGARFCASCGAELMAMKNVPAVKLPNVVDVAIKRISETNRLGNRVLLLTTILVRFKEIIGDEGVSPDAKLSEMRQLLVDHKI